MAEVLRQWQIPVVDMELWLGTPCPLQRPQYHPSNSRDGPLVHAAVVR